MVCYYEGWEGGDAGVCLWWVRKVFFSFFFCGSFVARWGGGFERGGDAVGCEVGRGGECGGGGEGR